ncbi:coadhesin-like [Ostrea edulis]|uniref:coadhesin-like n=1 Tax=Ostrea edulis TaxID=37623 RepID=UPI0024AE9F27|nr:coadhesin-like [Ostrea edulis]
METFVTSETCGRWKRKSATLSALAINGQELIITDAITSRIQNRGIHASVVFGTGEDVHITGSLKVQNPGGAVGHVQTVNGGWGSWKGWTQYTSCTNRALCGYGTQTLVRKRQCNKPTPRNGGRYCRGAKRDYKSNSCWIKRCPVHGRWGNRGSWKKNGKCSKSCGYGTQRYYQTRACIGPKHGGRPCRRATVQYKSQTCLIRHCPVHGRWGNWGSWKKNGKCSKSCGYGTQRYYKTRACIGPKHGGRPCRGATVQYKSQSCLIRHCPVNGKWTQFGPFTKWTPCNITCGDGIITRQQVCSCMNPSPAHGGRQCSGSEINMERKPCNSKPCPVNGKWTGFGASTNWTPCNVTCGGGTTTRKQVRTCTNPAPAHGGTHCSGSSVKIEKRDCNLNPCPVNGKWILFGSFTKWTPCNITCGGGITTRQQDRSCTNPSPAHGGKQCSGSEINMERRACNSKPCPVNGKWTDFGAFTNWTSCNVTCGGGTTTRKQVRTCTNPTPAHGGTQCSGPSVKVEKKDCNLNPCPVEYMFCDQYVIDFLHIVNYCESDLLYRQITLIL